MNAPLQCNAYASGMYVIERDGGKITKDGVRGRADDMRDIARAIEERSRMACGRCGVDASEADPIEEVLLHGEVFEDNVLVTRDEANALARQIRAKVGWSADEQAHSTPAAQPAAPADFGPQWLVWSEAVCGDDADALIIPMPTIESAAQRFAEIRFARDPSFVRGQVKVIPYAPQQFALTAVRSTTFAVEAAR